MPVSERRELARQAAADERSRREQIDALEEHRRRVMEEIGLLHERLGSIGDGLSAPVPAAESSRRPAQVGAPEPPADDAAVVQLPRPNGRRKVASSAR